MRWLKASAYSLPLNPTRSPFRFVGGLRDVSRYALDDAWKEVQSALVVKPLVADGAARQLKGYAQVGLGKVKDAAKDGAKGMDKALNK